MEWIFDGIGTALVTILISLLLGLGVRYYLRKRVRQKQTAGDNARQTQIGIIGGTDTEKTNCDDRIDQVQKAGDNATQTQVGRV